MRRTTTCIMGKLKFMHQNNVLDSYENEFEARVCNSTHQFKNRRKKRMHYQYHGVDDIKIMMDVGEVLSEFQVK